MSSETEVVLLGVAASLIAGLATGAGALPILFRKQFSDRILDALLGFAAGVMLAATAFSLLLPAIDLGGIWVTIIGFAIGAISMHLAEHLIPHMHLISGPSGPSSRLTRTWLLILAITLHNFPEGLAVGVSFGGGDVSGGMVIAMDIGLQNMPEGLAVALPLIRERYTRRLSLIHI